MNSTELEFGNTYKQELNWGEDPAGSQIRHLFFEIHYLQYQLLYLTVENRHLFAGIHHSAW